MPARAQGTPLQLSFFAVFTCTSILRDGGQKCKENLHPVGLPLKISPQLANAAERRLISGPETSMLKGKTNRQNKEKREHPLPLSLLLERTDLLGAENTVARVAQAGNDVALFIEAFVQGTGVDVHIGIQLLNVLDALGSGH